MRALAAILALMCAACGEDAGAFVYVTVEARPTVRDATTLRVVVENEGSSRSQDFALASDFPVTFTVTTPGRSGALEITVQAVGPDGQVASGAAQAELDGDRTDVSIMLDPDDFVVNRSRAETQWISFRDELSGRQIGVAPDDGRFVIAWENACPLSRCDILGRLFDAATEPLENGTTLTSDDFIVQQSPEYTESAAVAAGEDGFLIAWLGAPVSGDPFDVKAVTFDVGGAHTSPIDTAVTTTMDAEGEPGAIALDGGDYIVTWRHPRSADLLDGYEVLARRVRQDGTLSGAPLAVSASSTGDMSLAHAAPLPGGGWVVVWGHTASGETGQNVRARIFDAMDKATTLLDIPVTSYADAMVYAPHVTGLADGGFVTAWQAYLFDDPVLGDYPIQMRLFAADGTPRGPEAVVTPQTIDFYSIASLAARDSDGAIGVAWHDCGDRGDGNGCGISFRLYRPSGMPVGDARIVNTKTVNDQRTPTLTTLGPDAFLAAWTDTVTPAPSTDEGDVRARVIYPSMSVSGGVIGATCVIDEPLSCGDGLICVSDLCHETCSLPEDTPCPTGGTCRGGACSY